MQREDSDTDSEQQGLSTTESSSFELIQASSTDTTGPQERTSTDIEPQEDLEDTSTGIEPQEDSEEEESTDSEPQDTEDEEDSDESMSGTSTTTPTTPTPYKPDEPKMGGLVMDGPNIYAAWTGGKPKYDWSELEIKDPDDIPIAAVRPTYASSKQKWSFRRTEPPETLFKKEDPDYDRLRFQKDVDKHLAKCGMDTVMFVPSMQDPTKMINVVLHPDQATLEHVEKESKKLSMLFDKYDRSNAVDANEYIKATLGTDLKRDLELRERSDDLPAVTWMRVMHLVQDISIERYNRLKDDLKKISPLDEAGENVKEYGKKVRKICNILDRAGQFEWSLVLVIVRALCKVTVEAFRAIYLPVRHQVDGKLKEISFLDRNEQAKRMIAAGFHHQTLCDRFEDDFKSLDDNGEWGPSKNIKDPTKAPELNNGLYAMTRQEINNLVQKQVSQQIKGRNGGKGRDMSKVKCFACGAFGHFANSDECPQKKEKQDETAKEKGKDTPKAKSWRLIPPKDGEPHTKEKNGRTFNWCSKCKRGKGNWTPSHTDAGHVKKETAEGNLVETDTTGYGVDVGY